MTRPLAIFDLDNTLIDHAGAFDGWARTFLAGHGIDPAELAWMHEVNDDGFAPREEFLAAVLHRYGLDEPLEDALRAYREGIVARAELFPDTVEGLDRLAEQGWLVAIATNGSTNQQWAKLRRHHLDEHVHAVAVSEEVGARKPDRLMFETAATRCGIRLDGTHWMVGDCPMRDIGGAAAAGLRTVWMRRERAWDVALPAPTAVADTISDAFTALLVP